MAVTYNKCFFCVNENDSSYYICKNSHGNNILACTLGDNNFRFNPDKVVKEAKRLNVSVQDVLDMFKFSQELSR